jgi:hypothetical protein
MKAKKMIRKFRTKFSGKSGVVGNVGTNTGEFLRNNREIATIASAAGIVLLTVVVPVAIFRSMAATAVANIEPENGTRTTLATLGSDPGASGQAYVQFGTAGGGQLAFPKGVSANKRYLVDQFGNPYLVNADSPHTLAYHRTLAEVDQYLANRQSYEVNSLWVEVTCTTYISCSTNDGPTVEGYKTFTTDGDFSTPNPTYFSKLDQIVQKAQARGITLWLTPVETGGLNDTLNANGTTKAFNYGAYLGNRYKNYPNIVWQHGNDYCFNADAGMKAIMDGIRSGGDTHLQTLERCYHKSTTLDDQQWASEVNINESYTYYVTYDNNLEAYNQTPTMPMLMCEAGYEFENAGSGGQNTQLNLRKQEYWTMTTGATGQFYGNNYTWYDWDWATESANLNSPGIKQLQYMYDFFKVLPWYNLVPDQSHTLLTGGMGTYDNSTDINILGTNTYATAAMTPDGGTAVIYAPGANSLTVNMSKLKGPVTAKWFDPSTNTYTGISGSPFANTGSHVFTPSQLNGGGDKDWVLLLTSP